MKGKMSDEIHSKLTMMLDELTEQTNKMQTYQDTIRSIRELLKESVMVPMELLSQTQSFIEENKQPGFTTIEEFVHDAMRFKLTWLKSDNQCLEIPREDYEKLDEAVKKMDTPFQDAEDFINSQIRKTLEKYEDYTNERK
ncbi:MAG: hypothetical protein NWE99_10355 [Candidatus Bathyarchaeota archaeon]|nr:hypothetical protein [Candidatus Bathyarchaeota archaeon]